MIVIILEKAPPRLKGELTRWLHEPRSNVFVGKVSAEVRTHLWKKVTDELGPFSGALLIHNSDDEPGYRLQAHGKTKRRIVEKSGLQLVEYDHPNAKAAIKKLLARPSFGEPRLEYNPENPPGISMSDYLEQKEKQHEEPS